MTGDGPASTAAAATARSPRAPLIVTQVLSDPANGGELTNPYARLLVESFSPRRVTTRYFRWKGVLTDRMDVLHVHWPEHWTRHRLKAVRFIKCIVLAVFLTRLRVQKTAIVRTVHNLAPHEKVSWPERFLQRYLDHVTTLRFVMNDSVPARGPVRLVPHGHYRDWFFESAAPRNSTPGRFLTFGQIRAYKGVDRLVEAFRSVSLDGATLVIAGRPDTEGTKEVLSGLAAGDTRIDLALRFLDDDELAAQIASAEVVVLPYRQIYNSGAALLALSMNRPLLMPDGPATRLLRDEFGPDWIMLFEGELTAGHLERSVDRAQRREPASVVDMTLREWPRLAELLVDGYEDALSITRGERTDLKEAGS